MNALAAAAKRYASAGWPVFPLQARGKQPYAGSNGLLDATTDLEQVDRWWTARPGSNIGIRTGVVCDVLDLDGPDAEAAFDRHQLAGDLPMPGDHDWPHAPLWAATARGLHCYVTPSGAGNRAGLLDAHIDWRGAGGYVVAPPSIHPSGAVYRWAHPWRAAPPVCPPWLADLARGPRPATTVPAPVVELDPARGDGTRYGLRALEAECERVAAAPTGQRNHTLNAAAFALFQLVAGGELTRACVEECLVEAARRAGLVGREVTATLQSAWAKGAQHPRGAPETAS